jgi:hypothetical protein
LKTLADLRIRIRSSSLPPIEITASRRRQQNTRLCPVAIAFPLFDESIGLQNTAIPRCGEVTFGLWLHGNI